MAFNDQLRDKDGAPLKNLLGELEDILGPLHDKRVTINQDSMI